MISALQTFSRKASVSLLAILLLSSCADMHSTQSSAQDFSNAATSLVSAQRQVLNDLNAAILQSERDRQEAAYVSGADFSLDAVVQTIPAPTVDARVQATQAIQLYGQAVLGLVNGSTETKVDSYTEALAGSVKKTFPNVNVGTSGEVAAAVAGLANVALERYAYKSVVELAQAAQPNLVSIAKLFSDDTMLVDAPFQAAAMVDPKARMKVLTAIRSDPRVSVDKRDAVFNAMFARPPVADLSNEQANINQLVSTLVKSNAALAAGQTETFSAFAKAAYLRGKDMATVYSTVKNGK